MLKKMRGDWGYGQSKSELKEWGRGVDMEAFSPRRRSSAFRKSKGFNENDVVVLWVIPHFPLSHSLLPLHILFPTDSLARSTCS